MKLSRSPDGSYGFVIVGAVFLSNTIWICGIASFGVLYPEFLDYFGASHTITSWISSMHVVTYGCSGTITMFILIYYHDCADESVIVS